MTCPLQKKKKTNTNHLILDVWIKIKHNPFPALFESSKDRSADVQLTRGFNPR